MHGGEQCGAPVANHGATTIFVFAGMPLVAPDVVSLGALVDLPRDAQDGSSMGYRVASPRSAARGVPTWMGVAGQPGCSKGAPVSGYSGTELGKHAVRATCTATCTATFTSAACPCCIRTFMQVGDQAVLRVASPVVVIHEHHHGTPANLFDGMSCCATPGVRASRIPCIPVGLLDGPPSGLPLALSSWLAHGYHQGRQFGCHFVCMMVCQVAFACVRRSSGFQADPLPCPVGGSLRSAVAVHSSGRRGGTVPSWASSRFSRSRQGRSCAPRVEHGAVLPTVAPSCSGVRASGSAGPVWSPSPVAAAASRSLPCRSVSNSPRRAPRQVITTRAGRAVVTPVSLRVCIVVRLRAGGQTRAIAGLRTRHRSCSLLGLAAGRADFKSACSKCSRLVIAHPGRMAAPVARHGAATSGSKAVRARGYHGPGYSVCLMPGLLRGPRTSFQDCPQSVLLTEREYGPWAANTANHSSGPLARPGE